MDWRDEGVILHVKAHGETSAIVDCLTAQHGRCLGLVRGGRSRRMRPILQPGNVVACHWHARLEEHLGTYQLEPLELKAGFILEDRFKLAGLSSLTSLSQLLPEREPHPRLYEAARIVLDAFEHDELWPALMVRWEMGLLDELGFGIDLSRCAATGATQDMIYVSPKSGRAVSRGAGEAYASKLFGLPDFLKGERSFGAGDIVDGLKLTAYFIERHILAPRMLTLPQQRQWLHDELVLKVA